MTEPEMEISLTLTQLREILGDGKIRSLVEACSSEQPDRLGACAEEAIFDRLLELYGDALPPVSLGEWLASDPLMDDPERCRPCALPVTVQWYTDELEARGQGSLAGDLRRIGLSGTPEAVAAELDRIKQVVIPEVKARLLDFDAATQVNA